MVLCQSIKSFKEDNGVPEHQKNTSEKENKHETSNLLFISSVPFPVVSSVPYHQVQDTVYNWSHRRARRYMEAGWLAPHGPPCIGATRNKRNIVHADTAHALRFPASRTGGLYLSRLVNRPITMRCLDVGRPERIYNASRPIRSCLYFRGIT